MLDLLFAAASPAYGSLADPPGTSVLTAAVGWLEGTLLGSVATAAAVIATACAGFLMLSGRLSVRPGLMVILGSFVLFGASTIAAGISGSQGAVPQAMIAEPPAAPALPPPPLPPPVQPPAPADPFAGASVPEQ